MLWPSVRWIAFAYFKRFYLHQSAMEYFPKSVMMACYYLAAKIDEFNISIDNFVNNLRLFIKFKQIFSVNIYYFFLLLMILMYFILTYFINL